MKDLILNAVEVSPYTVHEKGEREAVAEAVGKIYSATPQKFSFIKKSIDARNKRNVKLLYKILAEFENSDAIRIEGVNGVEQFQPFPHEEITQIEKPFTAVIVGSGPAGLFCAVRLIKSGCRAVILERGKPISERDADIDILKTKGRLDSESNILFGEGGAGTYSDGKLTSRIHKGPIDYFFQIMKEFGAPEHILYDAKPHVGTDLLSGIIRRMKDFILEHGEIHFGKRAEEFIMSTNRVSGVRTASGEEFTGDAVIWAAGHSARDSYMMLSRNNVALESKGFAIGVRAEHPAGFINKTQYGDFSKVLPAADYRLAWTHPASKRGVYSFCMCPGGEVINSSSEQGKLCVNGMSLSARNSPWSNAAFVVSVHPEDFGGPLEGIALQRGIEEKAYILGGNSFSAPAQTIESFIRGETPGRTPLKTGSYLPGMTHAALGQALPSFIEEPLRAGLAHFERIIPGFASQGMCVGVETRTSSPVRIVRDEGFQSVTHRGLYPVGEGAGYAGGITSSAVDGIKCAEILLKAAQNSAF